MDFMMIQRPRINRLCTTRTLFQPHLQVISGEQQELGRQIYAWDHKD